MPGHLLFVIFPVLFGSCQAVLFIHPRDDANRAFRFEMQFLNQIRRLHRNCDARSVIDCARAQIPRIQMTGNDDYLFRILAAFDVTDNVVTLDIR